MTPSGVMLCPEIGIKRNGARDVSTVVLLRKDFDPVPVE